MVSAARPILPVVVSVLFIAEALALAAAAALASALFLALAAAERLVKGHRWK